MHVKTENTKQNTNLDRSTKSGAKEVKSLPAVSVLQPKANDTGMPDDLKSGIENLSGMDMSDVKVHYNSSQPAQMKALAYAQGNDIHIGPGQEQYLLHEAWHVVQQRQGRVKPTVQMKDNAINDDPGLEHEADVMGAKAIQYMGDPFKMNSPEIGKTNRETKQLKQVMQFGGGPKPSEVGLIDAEEITKVGDFVVYHGTKSDGLSYIEALILDDKTTVCAAYVQIVIAGDSVTLHTKAEGKYQGGIGTAILPIAIAVVANKHVTAKSNVTLPMGGAAVIKLLVEKLSKTLGNPDIHSVADLKKLERKKKDKESGASGMDPDVMDKSIAEEHKLHMQSLMKSKKGSELTFTSYGRNVVEESSKDIDIDLDGYVKKITEAPSQLFVDIPGNLFIEFAAGLR